jgi:signal transduction histidine kinase
MLEEVQSNLFRERASARAGALAREQHDALAERVHELREIVGGRQTYEKRIARAREALDALEEQTASFRDEMAAMKSSLQLVDLFALVRDVTEAWSPAVMLNGVEVTARIPGRGPVLLMDRESVSLALHNILGVLAPHVGKGDRVLIECSASDGRAVVLVADTAGKVDGTLLSRLFMPFTPPSGAPGDSEGALSVAGDILQRHAGEITVKSSPSWKTILVLSFPVAANSERRRERRDRRRRAERRGTR